MSRLLANILVFATCVFCVRSIWAADITTDAVNTKAFLARVGALDFNECLVKANGRERKVQCAQFDVAENPQDSRSKKISLFIVRLPARRPPPTALDPVLFIAGGPGQAASESFLFADQIYSALAKSHDFYLIDQRGTGRSNPLSCQDPLVDLEILENQYSEQFIHQATQTCLQQMSGEITHYTTENTIADFERVRHALQLNRWNLLGVSYGTRVAIHYLRRYPDRIRTAVLDSVVPPDHSLGLEIEQHSQTSLDYLIARCETDAPCHEAMPHLKQEIQSLITRLKNQSVIVHYENFNTGELQQMNFAIGHLRLLIRLYLYNPHSSALLPPMLHNAESANNFSALARAVQSLTQSSLKGIATGLHHSIMCTEDVPFYPPQTQIDPPEPTSYLGGHLIHTLRSVCSQWPTLPPPQDLKSDFVAETPTLLISGEYDPITPPSYAEHTQKFLPNSRHFIMRGQAHSVSGLGCMPYLIDKFVTSGSSHDLNADCLSRVAPIPLFVNMNGTAP